MTKSLEQIRLNLKCPGCGENVQVVWKAKLNSVIGIRYAFICSKCNKLIGIRNEKESTQNINLVPAAG